MEKSIALVLALALAASAVTAWGPHHMGMEEILEGGSYDDLVEYRKSVGWDVMPWVDSEEEFEDVRNRHEWMEGSAMGYRYHMGYGRTSYGGCPMWQ